MASVVALHVSEPREVRFLSEAVRLLSEATKLDEVKDIRDKAEALRLYIKQRGDGLEAQNAAAEIKIRAERRAGVILGEMDLKKGRPPEQEMSNDATFIPNPKLQDLGIDRDQSSRWQRTATEISDEDFEDHIRQAKAAGKELTTAGVLRLARQPKGPVPESQHWTLNEAMERLCDRLYEISVRWPPEYLDVMAHKLRSTSDELLEFRELRA